MAQELIEDLQRRLQERADDRTRDWWERYLKGEAAFRGVKMADVRAAMSMWADEHGVRAADALGLAAELFRQSHTEDKLAGVLLLRERHLGEIDPQACLAVVATALDDGHMADWSIVDWTCVKLLAGLMTAYGDPVARELAGWTDSPVLWRRRCALVPFAPLAPKADEATATLILEIASRLAPDGQRFAQTAIGWTLRELSKTAPERVAAFVDAHELSTEARRMALAKIEGRGRR